MQSTLSIGRSALLGMGVGAVYFGLAVLRAPARAIATDSATLSDVLLIFLGVGLAAGAVVGMVRSFSSGLGGMIVAATVLLSPAGFYAPYKEHGPISSWTWEAWVIASVYTGLLGYVAGVFIWRYAQRSSDNTLA